MKEIELINLKTELDLITEKKLVYVVLWNEYCSACKPMNEYIESIESEFPEFVFFKVHIDEPPLFAPGAIPCSVIFYQSVRMFESYGYQGESQTKLAMVLWREQWRERVLGPMERFEVKQPDLVVTPPIELEPVAITHLD